MPRNISTIHSNLQEFIFCKSGCTVKRTFKYHMTLQGGRGICSNRQSAAIWGRGDLVKSSSCNFYSSWKSLIHSTSCSIFGIREGRGGWLKTSWGGGGQKTSEYHHMEKGAKTAQKNVYDIWTYPDTSHTSDIILLCLCDRGVSLACKIAFDPLESDCVFELLKQNNTLQ